MQCSLVVPGNDRGGLVGTGAGGRRAGIHSTYPSGAVQRTYIGKSFQGVEKRGFFFFFPLYFYGFYEGLIKHAEACSGVSLGTEYSTLLS